MVLERGDEGAICTYKVTFPVSAGPTDILTVWFSDIHKTGVAFGVGLTYDTAIGAESILDKEEFKGLELLEPDESRKYEITWPFNFYVALFNSANDS